MKQLVQRETWTEVSGRRCSLSLDFTLSTRSEFFRYFSEKTKAKKYKKHTEKKFAFLTLKVFNLFNCKVCEMFVYKHTETREYVKN